MRARLMAFLAVCFAAFLLAPSAFAQDQGQSIKGTLRGPTGQPVAGVTLVVASGGTEVGTTKSAADGTWEVAVPKSGTYTVTLDVATLPSRYQLRNKGGETLSDVAVSTGQKRTVIFPLAPAGTQQQGGSPGSTTSASPGVVSGGGAGGSTGFATRFAQLVVEGIKFGAIIAITAIGLSLIFGTTGLINFAQGEMVTIGAMVAFFFSTSPFHLPLVVATLLAIVVGAGVGGAMERGIWRPMRRRGSGLIQMFIISIGLSLLIRHTLLVVFGSRRSQYSEFTVQRPLELGPVSITPRDLVVTLLCFAVLGAVAFVLLRTRIGKAMRAVADNRDLAEASGIDVDWVVLVVWLAGGGLAALGGVLFGLTTAIYWDMGFNLLLLMFAGVILGGLGSAFGAVVGSLVVGLVAQLSTLWFSPELQNAWALLALIVVLLIRPQGILGKSERAG